MDQAHKVWIKQIIFIWIPFNLQKTYVAQCNIPYSLPKSPLVCRYMHHINIYPSNTTVRYSNYQNTKLLGGVAPAHPLLTKQTLFVRYERHHGLYLGDLGRVTPAHPWFYQSTQSIISICFLFTKLVTLILLVDTMQWLRPRSEDSGQRGSYLATVHELSHPRQGRQADPAARYLTLAQLNDRAHATTTLQPPHLQ